MEGRERGREECRKGGTSCALLEQTRVTSHKRTHTYSCPLAQAQDSTDPDTTYNAHTQPSYETMTQTLQVRTWFNSSWQRSAAVSKAFEYFQLFRSGAARRPPVFSSFFRVISEAEGGGGKVLLPPLVLLRVLPPGERRSRRKSHFVLRGTTPLCRAEVRREGITPRRSPGSS